MSQITLYHGSEAKEVLPTFGLGNDRHDYGRGFYLTESRDLAMEWAVYKPNSQNGWLHQFTLNTDELKILDFTQLNILCWLAELMKHRDAADSKRYRMLSARFIEKYAVPTDAYDVIKGWRANASYFYIAKAFVRDEIDVDILEELMTLGGLGIQYCLKSKKAFDNIVEDTAALQPVDFMEFNLKYNTRDITARENMRELIDSDRNKVTKVFSTLI